VEQAAAAARSLEEQAQTLAESVSVFKLLAASAPAPRAPAVREAVEKSSAKPAKVSRKGQPPKLAKEDEWEEF
jgi:methyl-accepting chemotaxis protein